MAEVKSQEKRRFVRIAFLGPAMIECGGTKTECAVLDISLKGVLIDVPPTVKVALHTHCSVTVHLGAGDAHVTMNGEIVHITGNHLGVRCEEMDLDSATHLRRLVELNLGDDALLQRQLAALIS